MEDDTRLFSRALLHSKGAVTLIAVSTLVAVGLGSVIGLVPSTITDRFAELPEQDGSNGHCSDYKVKPAACIAASDEAERAATISNFCLNVLTLIFNPLCGSYSDISGRRPVLLLSLFLSLLPCISFLVLLKTPGMNPIVYYTASALTGLVNFPSMAFASLSDVIPDRFRARSYGVLLVGFFGGYSLAPSIALIVPNPVTLASVSLALILCGFLVALLFLPETLVVTSLSESPSQQSSSTTTRTALQSLADWTTLPFREIHILFENRSICLLSLANVLSAMVFASDVTLVIYYIQEKFQVSPSDMAGMFFALGIAGMIVQGVLLHPMIALWGENRTLILSFACGCLHNLLYGLASNKTTVCIGMIVSQLTKANFPLLSSLASRHDASRQGRMQGALFAVGALGQAIGPVIMKWLQTSVPSADPGIMFIFAAGLYFVGTVLVTCLDVFCGSAAPSPVVASASQENPQQDLQQPLLGDAEETGLLDEGHSDNEDEAATQEGAHGLEAEAEGNKAEDMS